MHGASQLAVISCSLGSPLVQWSGADIGCFCLSSPVSILLGTECFSLPENIFTTCARSMLPQRRPQDLGVRNVPMAWAIFPGCFCYHCQETLTPLGSKLAIVFHPFGEHLSSRWRQRQSSENILNFILKFICNKKHTYLRCTMSWFDVHGEMITVKLLTYPSPYIVTFFVSVWWWENLKSTFLANFQYSIKYINYNHHVVY